MGWGGGVGGVGGGSGDRIIWKEVLIYQSRIFHLLRAHVQLCTNLASVVDVGVAIFP